MSATTPRDPYEVLGVPRDAAEQDLHVTQQGETVIALRGVLVHHHDTIEKIIHRPPQAHQRLQAVSVAALTGRL